MNLKGVLKMIPYILILIGALSRLLPHPPNFTPVLALALYGGATLDRRAALIVPVGALLSSDLVIGFHSTMPFVYGSFLAVVALGMWLKHRLQPGRVIGATLAGSTFFFVVTCYGAWLGGGVPGRTFFENLTLSLPFYRNMLVGDVLYVGCLFGMHKAAEAFVHKRRSDRLSEQPL